MTIPVSPAAASCNPPALKPFPQLNSRGEYVCPKCGGSRMIEINASTVGYCSCRPLAEGIARLRSLGLLSSARRMTFETYQADEPWQKTLLERAAEFAVSSSQHWLFIGGQSGSGKTHLCTAAVTQRLLSGSDLHYMRWMNDTAMLKTLSLDAARSSWIRNLCDAPLLYIDDLFKLPPSPADVRFAFEILGVRCENPDKITVISSERTLPEITQIDEAVGGRIYERCTARYQLNIARNPARNYRFRAQEEI